MTRETLRLGASFLLVVLVSSILLGLDFKPAMAQSASIDGVDSPSVVRAGDFFSITAYGTYETSVAMELPVIIGQSDGSEVGRGFYSVTPTEGVITVGNWRLDIDLEAYTPDADEYDEEGRYTWELMAALHPFGNVEFSITIIRPDSDPYVRIIRVFATYFAEEEETSEVYVGSTVSVHVLLECSVPGPLSITLGVRDSLGIYRMSGPHTEDGWVETGLELGPTPFLVNHRLPSVRAPLDPEAEWLWEFRVTVEILDGRRASDEDSLTLRVLDREDRWASLVDLVSPSEVGLGESFSVDVLGAYVFPRETIGDLLVEITYPDGMPIPGGETQMIPDLTGRGPFSQIFTLTAPGAEGLIQLWVLLRISGDPEPVDVWNLIVDVRIELADVGYCRITGVEVDGRVPPQDVTYGNPFTVNLHLRWKLPSDSLVDIVIWDWDHLVDRMAADDFHVEDEGEGSDVISVEIPAALVPPRNGLWTLRAEVRFLREGVWEFTPDGYEQIFHVNIAGADGVSGGESDWKITGVSVSPVDPFLGTDVTFIARIEVTTSNPYPQTVIVSCTLDGTELFGDPATYEEGMSFLTVTSLPWIPTLGAHTLRWEVDSTHDYDDPNRGNNVMELGFTVTETPPMPEIPVEEQPPPGEEFDFYVTAVPTEQTVRSPVTYTVTVDVTTGTPEPVQLELVGAPAGVSYYFDPPSGNPSYTSTLTITTTKGLAAGTYPLTIKASGGGKERYKPVNLIVEQGPDYHLSITPDLAAAKPGETVEFTVSISSDTGYSQYVNLMVSGVPRGVTWNLEPRASTPTFQSTLVLELGKDVRPSVYRITVTGSGADAKRGTVTLRVEGVVERPGKEGEAMINYLAAAILGLIIAAVVGGGFYAVKRVRAKKMGVFCIECGAKLTPGTDFCPKCGTKQPKLGEA